MYKNARKRKGLKVFSFGQKLRRFKDSVLKTAGAENAKRISDWIKRKKEGWFNTLNCPEMSTTSTRVDQAHNAFARKLFMMKGFHHPNGAQSDYINGIAMMYNFIPYQRRAKNAGKCGVEVEGGILPSRNWFLALQILTSGGFE